MSNQSPPNTYTPPEDPLQTPANRDLLKAVNARLAALVYPETDSNNSGTSIWFWSPELYSRRHNTVEAILVSARSAPYEQHLQLLKTATRISRCTESGLILRQKHSGQCAVILPPCNHRLCPVCQIRLSRARAAALLNAVMPALAEGHLTSAVLTVPNCNADDLRDTCAAIKQALTILRGNQGGKSKAPAPWDQVKGGAWNLEVTYNPNSNTYHPHIHLLIHAPFIPGKQARDAWKRACAAVGITAKTWRVHLSQVKADPQDIGSAVAEVSKYVTKPISTADRPCAIRTLITALHGIRLHDSWGTLHYSTHTQHPSSDWEVMGGMMRFLRDPDPTSYPEVREAVLKSPLARALVAKKLGFLTLLPYGEKQP